MPSYVRWIFKWAFFALLVVFLGGIGTILLEHYALPQLSANPAFKRIGLFKKATETTTVINNTQQVVVRDDDSVEKIATQTANAVVSIVSIEKAKPTEKQAVVAKTKAVAPAPVAAADLASQSGSGVILTNDGIIATYRSAIIEQNAEYTVLLSSGAAYPATLQGIDPLTNVALLHVDATGLPAIAFANSDDMRPGKKLIMLANSSEEYQNRFSQSLLSDINRSFNLSEKTVSSSEKWEGVFEVDMASPGSYLGGPAINFNGELVGILGSSTLDNQTSYFLLPGNILKQALERFIDSGFANRPTLGVYYVTITKTYGLTHGLNRDRGALIFAPSVAGHLGTAVIEGSPADHAGLRSGDIVTAVNGKEVNLDSPLSDTIGALKKGDQASLLIIRDGQEQTLTAQL